MAINNLQDALVDSMKDLLHAEKQLTKALPKMAKNAENPQLKKAFEQHLKQTEEQVARLEQVFEIMGLKPKTKPCEAMKGLIEEAKEHLEEDVEPQVLDAMLIASAQKVEHYEIAAYGTACTWAEQLGINSKALRLLKQSLAEEKETDEKLTRIAEQNVNVEAMA